jgi:hypothetical protein
MPQPEQTGYLLVHLTVGNDDAPTRDPVEVARELADIGRAYDIAEVETVYNDGFGHFVRYGEASGGGSFVTF